MIIKNKKGESGTFEIFIGLILAIIVVALILGMIFRADILNWIRSLPDYGSDEDKLIDSIDDEVVNNVRECYEIGKLAAVEKGEGLIDGGRELVTTEYARAPLFVKILFFSPALEIAHSIYPKLSENKIYHIYLGESSLSYSSLGLYQEEDKIYVKYDSHYPKTIGILNNQRIFVINDESLSDESKLLNGAYLGGVSGMSICKKGDGN